MLPEIKCNNYHTMEWIHIVNMYFFLWLKTVFDLKNKETIV